MDDKPTSTSATTTTTTTTTLLNSLPLPLSATQESQVRALYHARVRAYCAQEIKDFAQCARNLTITATWKCRSQRIAMNWCMIQHATQEELDKARKEWFRIRLEKRAKGDKNKQGSKIKEEVVK